MKCADFALVAGESAAARVQSVVGPGEDPLEIQEFILMGPTVDGEEANCVFAGLEKLGTQKTRHLAKSRAHAPCGE